MSRELWTTADIARERGLANAAVARSWIKRVGLDPVDRVGDAKVYDADEVRAKAAAMPGKGVGGGRPRTRQ